MRKKYMLLCIFIVFISLSGCGKKISRENDKISLQHDDYVKKFHRYTTVQRGDILPSLELYLKPDEYKVKSYMPFYKELDLLSLNVEKGDYVTEGMVMAVFFNGGIDEQIIERKQEKEELLILIEHYERLDAIEGQGAYSETIASLKEKTDVIDAYIKEDEERLKDYMLIADCAGTVIDINKILYMGNSGYGESLIKVASGTGNYYAETDDDYPFCVGDEFIVTHGITEYVLRLNDIEFSNGKKKLTFVPLSDMSGITGTDTLLLHIDKDVIKDVLYVDEDAIYMVSDKYYVFKLDEKGYRHAVEVFPQSFVSGYAILTDEISDGEQVTLK